MSARSFSIPVFFVLILLTAVSHAQKDSITQLRDIVVTVNRSDTRIKDLPYAVNRVDQRILQRNLSRTIPEALNGIAGLFIQKTNHGGGSVSYTHLTLPTKRIV